MTSRPPSSAEAAGAPLARRHRPARRRLRGARAAVRGAHRRAASAVRMRRVLEAWADAGLRLRAEAGWRGERLAQELFAVAPAGAAAARRGRRRTLGGAGAATAAASSTRRSSSAPCRPRSAAWDAATRTAWLDAALALPPRPALAAYRDLPGALERVAAMARPPLLAAWRAAARDDRRRGAGAGDPAARRAPRGGARRRTRRGRRRASATWRRAFPAGVPGLLRSLPQLYDEADRRSASANGTAHGLGLAPRRRAAGVAFFALASRTSRRVLAASPTAVALDEMQGELRRLVHMLSGAPAAPRPAGPFRLRPPLEESPGQQHGGAAPGDRRGWRPARTTRGSTACRRRWLPGGGSSAPTPRFPTAPRCCAAPGRSPVLEDLLPARRRRPRRGAPVDRLSRCRRRPALGRRSAGRRGHARRLMCSTPCSRSRCAPGRDPAACRLGSPGSPSSCCRACVRWRTRRRTAADALANRGAARGAVPGSRPLGRRARRAARPGDHAPRSRRRRRTAGRRRGGDRRRASRRGRATTRCPPTCRRRSRSSSTRSWKTPAPPAARSTPRRSGA